ncbi:MAG: TraB/GumN family protein, partial [Pseudomonadales bacterium]
MPMGCITTALLTLLLTVGLQAKADITLDALEAGSGVSWPQGLRDAVSPFLGDLNSQAPHRAMAVSVDDALEAFAVGSAWQAPSPIMASQAALQGCEQDRAAKGLQVPCEILVSDDAIMPLGRALRAAADLDQGSQVWRVEGPKGTLYLVGSVHVLKPSLFPLPPVYEQAYAA